MMRSLFMLLFLAGAGVAFAYPLLLSNSGIHDVGNWRVEKNTGGFAPVEVMLKAADAPMEVLLEITAVVPAAFDRSQSVLTITAATAGQTVLARTLSLDGAEIREDSPQTPQQIYRIHAGTIPTLVEGAYILTVGPGDAEGVEISSVDVILQGGGGATDPRAMPLGFSLMAVGFIGFVLSFRDGRSAGKGAPATPAAKPRWGRDAGER
jgi:hypothetical protein